MNCITCNKPNKLRCKKMCNNCYKKYLRDKHPKIPCACNCGTMIPPITTDGKPAMFASGHNFNGLCNPNFNGYRYLTSDGDYWMTRDPDNPEADSKGYVLEHRSVARRMLRRDLKPDEQVHHINKNTHDNRPENLRVYNSKEEHMRENHWGKYSHRRL